MINSSCRHFRGSEPCRFNKSDGSECPSCAHVSEFQSRVLIIKLDALGDVLRTGSLLPMIRARHQDPFITWLTRPEAAELVGLIRGVDEVIALSVDGLARLAADEWDVVYSLSNDLTSASLAVLAAPDVAPIGYSVHRGILQPSNDAATRWLQMGSFDRLKRQNTDSYQRIMLDIIEHDGPITPPELVLRTEVVDRAAARVSALFPGSNRCRVAIGIGSGIRWPKKILDERQIGRYVRALGSRLDVDILLVGGPGDQCKAEDILRHCGKGARVREALTPASVHEFIAVLQQADALLCGDTLAVHVAGAIGLPAVCLFGPTSAAEIPDFDGLISKTWVTQLACLGCYGDCDKVQNCMSLLEVDDLVDLTHRQLVRRQQSSGLRELVAHLSTK